VWLTLDCVPDVRASASADYEVGFVRVECSGAMSSLSIFFEEAIAPKSA